MKRRRHALLLPGLVLASALSAAEAPRVGTDSPFLPAAAEGAAGKAADAPLELRGVLSMGGETRFNIVDAATHKGSWVALNQPGDFRVVSYEKVGDSDTVTVEQGGRSLRLELVKPKTGKAAPPPARTPGAAAAAQQPGPVTPVVLNPTPADQARALEDTIAEVRRRRLLRQQGQQPGAAPAPQPVQPQAGRPPAPPPGTP